MSAAGTGASHLGGSPAGRIDEAALTSSRVWRRHDLHVHEVTFAAPLDHFGRSAGTVAADVVGANSTLEIFARIISAEADSTKPYLVYLQGGPGFEATRPTTPVPSGSWIARALGEFQVVLLDQRGTGKSSPIGSVGGRIVGLPGVAASADAVDPALDPALAAELLSFYRADSIVEDAEILRTVLGVDTWSLLGQSFGGFTALRYVSAHSSSLSETYFTGGLPAIATDPVEVYSSTWERLRIKSEQYYRAFPDDRDRMARLVATAESEGGLVLPGGARAGAERLRLLGHFLGASDGPEKLHWLLENDSASATLRHDVAAALPFSGRNPLYAVVHESCWADGVATNWAARRAMPAVVADDPTLLAGEHSGRESFVEDPELAPFAEVADLVAARDWPRLYDEDALRAANVRGGAAVYFEDAYVPAQFSLATADLLGGVHPWVTNEYEHNGLRADGWRVLDRLIGLARG